jgi:transglutaminase/protease-like cytokinesis protein 3
MALNIEYVDDPSYQSDITTEEIALVTLQTKKSGCEGTARLFYELCKASRLECEVIFGYALGLNYDNNRAIKPNHGWNAVKINDKWELVDATWGSGGSTIEDGKEVYISELDLRYLFADPKSFVIDHFPQQARWQLMEKPISKRTFFSDEYDMRRMGKLVKYSK